MRMSKLRFCLSIGMLILMTLVLGACISTSSEPEIEATRVLSPAPEITATIPSSFSSVGEGIYQARCVNCHGEQGLGDGDQAGNMNCEIPKFTERMADVTLDDYVATITNGRIEGGCAMPPFGEDSSNPLTEEEILEVAQYVYDFADGGEVVVDNSPQETEEPTDISPAIDETPDVTSTEEPVSDEDTDAETHTPATSTDEIEMFSINGTIINGTSDAAIPNDLTLELIILDEDPESDPDSEPIEIYSDEAQIDVDGRFTFSDIPHEGLVLSIQTRYGGIVQQASAVIISRVTEDIDDFEFTIYEVTDDPSRIHITTVESFVGAVTSEGLAQIIQSISFTNTGDRIFYQADGYSTEVLIPSGTLKAEMFAFTSILGQFVESGPDRFLAIETEDGIVFKDTKPLFPGNSIDQIIGDYTIPYSGTMTVTQSFFYIIDELIVNTSERLNLQLESDQLSPNGTTTFQEAVYNRFDADTPFPINTALIYQISDGPNSGGNATSGLNNPIQSEEESFLQENSSFILGLGILLIVAGSIYLFYDLQKARILTQSGSASGANLQSEDELIDTIAELDDAFESGELEEDDYEGQRAKLKDRLIKMRLDE